MYTRLQAYQQERNSCDVPQRYPQDPQLGKWVSYQRRNRKKLAKEQEKANVYEMVMAEVEPELLKAVMRYTNNNQSKAAKILGINRGTFRTKLKKYGIIK